MKILQLLFAILFLVSCSEKKAHPYTFYYWKTNLALDKTEKKALAESTTHYLCTRFFDVDKTDGKFEPVAVITKDRSFSTEKEIIPTIFITNRTFFKITDDEIDFLSKSIDALIEKKVKNYLLSASKEIQIDCDWTAGTRDDYFKFLKKLKQISGKEITCTLRLHQVKDKNIMGVPPVEKVYLMCYSTSSPLENSDKNSILNVAVLKSYLSKLEEYPLKKIEVALPIYSWGIVTNHLGKHKLINALSEKDLENPDFRKISDHEIEITKDGFYFNHFLSKGFRVKTEEITGEETDQVIRFLDKKIGNYTVIYYQLDSKFVKDRDF